MPHAFPPYLKDWLKEHMTPLTAMHKMWWMRCEIMQVEPMMYQSPYTQATKMPYFRIGVRDIDAKESDKKGYEFDIRADGNKDFRPQDRISLFGHEPLDATHISYPRFYINHETKRRGHCCQTKYLDFQRDPASDEVSTLWVKTKKTGGFAQRILRGTTLLPLYEQIAVGIDKYIHHESGADAAYACKNPRPKNQQGGALVD